jgi:hypothetical protein
MPMKMGEGAMTIANRTAALWSVCRAAVLVATLASCSAGSDGGSGFSLGNPFAPRAEKPIDPNIYPASYKADLLAYLQTHVPEIEGVTEASISAPALAQLSGNESRYFMCFRAAGANFRREKMIVFFGGQIIQFVNATGPQCATAAYEPFPELVAIVATLKGKKS